MKPFRRVSSPVAVLDRPDVDTDQIIPKQFLKRIERTGFGQFLFFDWRLDAAGQPRPEFELNDPACAGAKILIAGANFGCGSSREHAAWALQDYGFEVVIPRTSTSRRCTSVRQKGTLKLLSQLCSLAAVAHV